MSRNQKKTEVQKVAVVSLRNEIEIDTFLTEVDEAKRYVAALEMNREGLSPTEIVAIRTNLPLAREQNAALQKRLKELRGDDGIQPPVAAVCASIPDTAKPDGRMMIQAEAYECWIRLKAAGANPSVHSICLTMAKWCADNGVTTRTGTTPTAGTIRNSILGGSSGWQPPTHSRDRAIAHVAQLAQVAHSTPASGIN